MREYWIVCFSENRWDLDPLVAGPWYRKKYARERLESMKTDDFPLVTERPRRFIVKTVR